MSSEKMTWNRDAVYPDGVYNIFKWGTGKVEKTI